ncbi:MAG: hypothetical protein P1U89_14160 [Verrucomicrobiales bacterium]|nr:hypothetical protein [Verrucomicrobiales bacterium]
MKLGLLTTLIGALGMSGVIAGEYCPPVSEKCPIECAPDSNGELTIGYHTDYILHGVRLLRDNITADVNYTFDSLPVPVTLGVTQITGLGSDAINGADESDIYGAIELPSVMGLTTTVGYIHRFFPTLRTPTNGLADSRGEAWLKIEKDLGCGINVYYRRGYDFNMPSGASTLTGNTQDEGAWIHTLGAEKDICLTDAIGLSLAAGVLYTDNYYPGASTAFVDGTVDHQRASGWNSYFIKASLPIALGCNATLVPYVGYNGTPDTWLADGVDVNPFDGNNANDVFHGGVSLTVEF